MDHSGYDLVGHRVKQIINSFDESRNLLAEIEDDLHASNQLRRGESDRISEVDAELLRCSSLIQGGWDRVLRLKGKGELVSDDPIMFVLEKTFDAVECKLYKVLLDAHTNEGFLDYGSLMITGLRQSKPLVDALKSLAQRIRASSGMGSPSEVTPPTSASDGPGSRSQSRSRVPRSVRDPHAALGSSRHDRQGLLMNSYNPQIRKGTSLTSSSYGGSGYESDSYRSDNDQYDDTRSRDHESISTRSFARSSQSTQSSWSNTDDYDNNSKHRPPPLFANKSRNHSEASSQLRVVSSIQEELPDLNIGSLRLSPDQLQPMTFDSRNNSTSDDGGHRSHIYGSSWKSSSIVISDALPSPVSPGPMFHRHDELTYRSNVGKIREMAARQQARDPSRDVAKKHESVEAVSPHSQSRKKHSHKRADSFGPPPAPPPVGRLPEPPRVAKVSLFPAETRRDEYKAAHEVSVPRNIPSANSRNGFRSEIPPSSLDLVSRQEIYNATPPDREFHSQNILGTHGLDFTPPQASPTQQMIDKSLRSMPGHQVRVCAADQGPRSIPETSLNRLPIGKVSNLLNSVDIHPDTPPVQSIAQFQQLVSNSRADLAMPAPRPSYAQTTSSEGTMTQEKWLCLTRTVKQIPGLASPPIELIPSTSSSTRPEDNLPSDANKYWSLCKNAVAMQIGDGKKSAEEVANRPTGITGNEKYMKCRKCKYEYSAYGKDPTGKGAMTDPRWKEGPKGLMYKETLLFKLHVTTKKDKLPQEEHHFGCIFCAATGNGMPIYKGKTSFITHLTDHGAGNYPNDVLKTRIKFTTRREHEPSAQDMHFELILP